MSAQSATTNLAAKLRGILLPVTTPFHDDSELDLTSLVSNLDHWQRTGITGFVMLGSTGERVHLDEYEYLRVIETARENVSANMGFIVGAGQQSTVGTIKEIERAARAGAEAVLVITPCFYRSAVTQEALVGFYTGVADASPVPVLLYSMPALTGVKIEPETIARLSDHENIIGAKDSSADIPGFKRTVELCRQDFAVMTGNGTVLLDALRVGATGGILAVGCAVPQVCVEIFRAFNAGEDEIASALQERLTPLAAAVTTRFGIGGLKAALEINRYHGGSVRAPLRMPDHASCLEISELLEEAKKTLSQSIRVRETSTANR